MRYTVTGAAGFVGTHVAAALLGREHELILIDLPDRLPGAAAYCDVLSELGYTRLSTNALAMRPADLCDADERVLDGSDAIVHLAGIASPRTARQYPGRTRRVNAGATERLLRSGRPLVFASTYLLYGVRSEPFRATEDAPFDRSGWGPYEASKHEAEQLVLGNNGLVFRFPNIYGPGQGSGFLVPDIIERIRNAEDRIDMFNPDTERDYLYVGDAAGAVCHLADAGCRGVYNIGSGTGARIRDVYDEVRRSLGTALPYRIMSDERSYLVQDITKIRRTGFPQTTLGEGIERTVRP